MSLLVLCLLKKLRLSALRKKCNISCSEIFIVLDLQPKKIVLDLHHAIHHLFTQQQQQQAKSLSVFQNRIMNTSRALMCAWVPCAITVH